MPQVAFSLWRIWPYSSRPHASVGPPSVDFAAITYHTNIFSVLRLRCSHFLKGANTTRASEHVPVYTDFVFADELCGD